MRDVILQVNGVKGADVNSQSNDAVPNVTSDGETMVFAFDRAGGFGLSDIYMTARTKWHSR